MPNRCMVFGCHNTRKNNKDVTYHRLPLKKQETEILKKWLQALKLENPPVNEHSAVCSLHFEASCFKPYGNKGLMTLKDDAIPTLHLTDGYAQSEAYKKSKDRSGSTTTTTAMQTDESEPSASSGLLFEPISTSTPTKLPRLEEDDVNLPSTLKRARLHTPFDDLDTSKESQSTVIGGKDLSFVIGSSSSSSAEDEDGNDNDAGKCLRSNVNCSWYYSIWLDDT
ncbi:THAP domain-containing protein 1-like [Anneissia japonica]|uniref:THAP domain-containing protein 1-like n=1 Tax=Anneissia japonica TaxID=1529436 RepID=UPI0014259746|nr:THAP domain-containing protein 1-like [Anneissia japonica]